MAQLTRVLIADDSVHVRAGLRALLATWPDILVVGEAENGRDAVRLAAECRPNVVLMDMQMPLLDGLQATRLIKQQSPAVAVIVLTMYAVERSAALSAGADAFLIKASVPEQLLATFDHWRSERSATAANTKGAKAI